MNVKTDSELKAIIEATYNDFVSKYAYSYSGGDHMVSHWSEDPMENDVDRHVIADLHCKSPLLASLIYSEEFRCYASMLDGVEPMPRSKAIQPPAAKEAPRMNH
jgi:hypothetical protein